ncbi:hypothetical protein DSECCO2_288560 [anaerobic digester metagenome]
MLNVAMPELLVVVIWFMVVPLGRRMVRRTVAPGRAAPLPSFTVMVIRAVSPLR